VSKWIKTSDRQPEIEHEDWMIERLKAEDLWDGRSRSVLVWHNHKIKIAYLYQFDLESEVKWQSDCSESWEWKLEEIEYWRELPDFPPPFYEQFKD